MSKAKVMIVAVPAALMICGIGSWIFGLPFGTTLLVVASLPMLPFVLKALIKIAGIIPETFKLLGHLLKEFAKIFFDTFKLLGLVVFHVLKKTTQVLFHVLKNTIQGLISIFYALIIVMGITSYILLRNPFLNLAMIALLGALTSSVLGLSWPVAYTLSLIVVSAVRIRSFFAHIFGDFQGMTEEEFDARADLDNHGMALINVACSNRPDSVTKQLNDHIEQIRDEDLSYAIKHSEHLPRVQEAFRAFALEQVKQKSALIEESTPLLPELRAIVSVYEERAPFVELLTEKRITQALLVRGVPAVRPAEAAPLQGAAVPVAPAPRIR